MKFGQPIKIVSKSSNEGTSCEPETIQRDVNFRWLKSTNKRSAKEIFLLMFG